MLLTSDKLRFSIVTANLLHLQDPAHAFHDCMWIRDNWFPDVIGVQEAYSYGAVLQTIPDYALAVPKNLDPMLGRNRILYNTKFLDLVEVGAQMMHPTVEGQYAVRMVAYTHLRDKFEGNDLWFFDFHLDPGIEAGGRPVLPSAKTEASLKMIADLAPMIAKKSAGSSLVYWMGDQNMDEMRDNAKNDPRFVNSVFRKAGLISVYDELKTPADFDTVGGSTIDVIGRSLYDSRGHFVSVERSPGQPTLFSDHRFVKATVELNRLP